MCRLYEIVCILFRTRLIVPRINSPIIAGLLFSCYCSVSPNFRKREPYVNIVLLFFVGDDEVRRGGGSS